MVTAATHRHARDARPAIAEAMAVGPLVMITRVDGVPGMMSAGPDRLGDRRPATALLGVLADPDLTAARSRRAGETAPKPFDALRRRTRRDEIDRPSR